MSVFTTRACPLGSDILTLHVRQITLQDFLAYNLLTQKKHFIPAGNR